MFFRKANGRQKEKKSKVKNGPHPESSFAALPCAARLKTLILHESEDSICKAFNGAAIVNYYKLLITRQMGASGSPSG